jgi:flavorubredoxin
MVHWPDSMVTYCNQEKLLLSNDAFGQHIASAHRFDDEIGWDILQEEAAKYYANIVLPYGDQVKKALSDLAELEIEMIAPSHGAIWRSYINNIIQEYEKWSSSKTNDRALIVFDSMWGTTEQLAYTLYESLDEAGVPVFLRDLKSSHISDIIKDVLTSKLILLGSPTLNNGMLPSMGEFLTYLKGLRPRNRIGFVFGSYGWGGQAVKHIESVLQELSWEIPLESINIQYIPDENELQNVKETGKKLVKYLNNRKIVA